jgi:phage shock protein A
MDTIEKSEHERLLTEQKEQFETQIAELQTSLGTVQAELDALKPQYDELAAYKQTIEEATAKEEKLASIKQKFEDAHLEITDEYFSERAESFASMTDEQLEFFIQELVAAFKPAEEGKASVSITSKDVPPIRTPEAETITPKDMVTYLRKTN